MYVCTYMSVTLRNVTLRNFTVKNVTLRNVAVSRLQNVTRVCHGLSNGVGGRRAVVSRARRILRGPVARAGKNTSGNYCHISGGVAGILAPPIRLQD